MRCRVMLVIKVFIVVMLCTLTGKSLHAGEMVEVLKDMMTDLGGAVSQLQYIEKTVKCAYGGTRSVQHSATHGAEFYRGTYSNCREQGKTRDGIYEIEIGNGEVVEFRSKRSINGELFDAVRRGDHNAAKKLIHRKADVNYSEPVSLGGGNDVDNWTPLMSAIVNNDISMVELLISTGSWINFNNSKVVNSLWLAAANGHSQIAKLLIARGAYVNNSNFEDMTPLMVAAMNGHKETVLLLLQARAKRNLVHQGGDSALMFAVAGGHVEVARLLIDSGSDVLLQNIHGITALHIAAAENNPDIVKRLLEAGADRMARDRSGRTPLNIANFKGNKDVEELLKDKLSQGSSVP